MIDEELKNAEYSMMCEELSDYVKECYGLGEDGSKLSESDLEKISCVLAALTGNYDIHRLDLPKQTDNLICTWENELSVSKNEFVIGKHYIRISGILLFFISAAASTGLLDMGIQQFTAGTPILISASQPVNVVLGLVQWFQTVQDLDDDDFCVYMQAVTHSKQHKQFTENELLNWFPHGENQTCNMHNSKWDCAFLNRSDMCEIIAKDKLNDSIKSLEKKKLLKSVTGSDMKTFRFVIW